MKKTVVLFVLAGHSALATLSPIEMRAQRGEAMETTSVGKAYQDAMWPQVGPYVANVMRDCFKSHPNSDLSPFIWVANITAEGTLSDVTAQPVTPISRCFEDAMQKAPFPKPPPDVEGGVMPITFRMKIHNEPPP